ncbi:hypothetical protein JAAARDRAFT_67462 [Jaapia argillacea MUCL 33604]|uniref:AAA+ ATPase domain-containing protein n=1 Tax=Jaapia argillacea MUCL 33604 TaxID=933084 RepID=A0A067QEM2_9AGAM|nr:hypothetical protein JAAARDRAFT_67462 [Jaapia argillacea MUCL 33604]
MTEIDSFRPTGLLGGFDEPRPLEDPVADGFLSTGLLGDGFGEASMLQAAQLEGSTLVGESFIANGLLDGAGPEDSQGSQEMQESQDLPDLSEILRDIPRRENPISTTATSTASHLPPTFIRATTYNGKTVIIRRKRKAPAPIISETTSHYRMSKLLDVPIHRLMDQLSASTAEKLAQPQTRPHQSNPDSDDTLWVDRYRPQRFTDLIGDDRVHRETMTWVKEWDFCVFGKKKGKKRARDDAQEDEYRDEYHRPRERILLLSGPPGLGKTTLANVIAQQAGYSVFEINASDARSGSIVDDRIRPALESGSAIGSSKPVLVVIDEIDGATGAGDNSNAFVHKLVELTLDKPRKKRNKRDPKSSRPLLRPIICICNDLYASSLAKLRPHARIIRFNRPADLHVVKRLREICETECLRADSRALSALVGVARGDMRGCLNTLQFIKAKNQEVSEHTIRAATMGMKEADTSLTSVLNDLFSPMSKKRVKELGLGEEEEGRYVDRLSREIDGSGAMDKIASGCFEHYANLRRHDATLARYEKANEWLCVFDRFSGSMRSEREYALMPYLSYTLIPFYHLFQERGAPKVERPKADWEHFQQTRTNEEIYQSLGRCLRTGCSRRAGSFRHLLSDQILQLEFAPYINRIISPPLRPVNSQVIKPEERVVLSRLVSIMVSLDLRFIQEKAEDGQLVYRLEPPIDVFVTYDGKRAADIAVSRYAVRHVVATELEAQSIAHQAEATERVQSHTRRSKASDDLEDDRDADHDEETGGRLTRSSQPSGPSLKRPTRLDKDKVDIADMPPTDFFGRLITAPHTSASTKSNTGPDHMQNKKYRVSYRFNEGNSAAVRKPVKVSSFL